MHSRQALAALAAIFVAGSTQAQPAECFCLSHARHAYFLYGCRAAGPEAPDAAFCLDVDAQAESGVRVPLADGWERIPDGRGDCLPCRPRAIRDYPENFREIEVDEAPLPQPSEDPAQGGEGAEEAE